MFNRIVKPIEKVKRFLLTVVVTGFVCFAVVTVTAIALHYDGEIHLRFGVGSGELIINNQKEAESPISIRE